jgi:hypothetical protein
MDGNGNGNDRWLGCAVGSEDELQCLKVRVRMSWDV